MPLTFILIPAAFVLFGFGRELARVTMPRKGQSGARARTDVMPNVPLPRSLSIQFGCDLPGVRVGLIYSFVRVLVHGPHLRFFVSR